MPTKFQTAITNVNEWSTPTIFLIFHFLFVSSWCYTAIKFTAEVMYPNSSHDFVASMCALYGFLFSAFMLLVVYGIQVAIKYYKQKSKYQIWLKRNDLEKSKWVSFIKHGDIVIRFLTCLSFPMISAVIGDSKNISAYLDILCSGTLSIMFLCITFELSDDGGATDAVNAVVLGIIFHQKHRWLKIALAAIIPTLYHVIPKFFKRLVEWAGGPRTAAIKARNVAKSFRQMAKDTRLKAALNGNDSAHLIRVAVANENAATASIGVAIAYESLAHFYDNPEGAEVEMIDMENEAAANAAAVTAAAAAADAEDDAEVLPPVRNWNVNVGLHFITLLVLGGAAFISYTLLNAKADPDGSKASTAGKHFHSFLSFMGTNPGKK